MELCYEKCLRYCRNVLLTPAGLSESQLEAVLGRIIGRSVDNADFYFQIVHHESWMLEDGLIKEGSFNLERGVGIRAMSGEKTGFAYSDDIYMAALEQAADAARSIAKKGGGHVMKVNSNITGHELYRGDNPLASFSEQEKIQLLQKVDAEARRLDPRVSQVIVSLAGVHEVVLVMNSNGTMGADVVL